MNTKLKATILFLLFSVPIFSQNLNIEDFFIVIKQEKIHLGDSLIKYDPLCGTKKVQTKETVNMKYKIFDYSWGKVYTSFYSDDYTIFGIEITDNSVSIIKNIQIGTSEQQVEALLGNPAFERDHEVYYYNDDFDVLEICIKYNNENIVSAISLFMGT